MSRVNLTKNLYAEWGTGDGWGSKLEWHVENEYQEYVLHFNTRAELDTWIKEHPEHSVSIFNDPEEKITKEEALQLIERFAMQLDALAQAYNVQNYKRNHSKFEAQGLIPKFDPNVYFSLRDAIAKARDRAVKILLG